MKFLTHNNFLNKWFFSTNHKQIGLYYFIFGVFLSVLGATYSFFIRTELTTPGSQWLHGNYHFYNTLITGHGLVMIFFAAMPILLGGFVNWFILLLIGAPDMAYPRLNNLSFWLLPASLLLFILYYLTNEVDSYQIFYNIITSNNITKIAWILYVLFIVITFFNVISTLDLVNYNYYIKYKVIYFSILYFFSILTVFPLLNSLMHAFIMSQNIAMGDKIIFFVLKILLLVAFAFYLISIVAIICRSTTLRFIKASKQECTEIKYSLAGLPWIILYAVWKLIWQFRWGPSVHYIYYIYRGLLSFSGAALARLTLPIIPAIIQLLNSKFRWLNASNLNMNDYWNSLSHDSWWFMLFDVIWILLTEYYSQQTEKILMIAEDTIFSDQLKNNEPVYFLSKDPIIKNDREENCFYAVAAFICCVIMKLAISI